MLELKLRAQQTKLDTLHAKICQKEEENQAVRDDITSLESRNAGIQKKITYIEEDLAVIRHYAPEMSVGKKEVYRDFLNFLEFLNSFHLSCERVINPSGGMSEAQAQALREEFKGEGKGGAEADFVRRYAHRGNASPPLINVLLRHHFASYLMDHVFKPFLPAYMDGGTQTTFADIHETMYTKEPQNRSGPWRAMTAKHLMHSRASDWCTEPVLAFVSRLRFLAGIFNPIPVPEATFEAAIHMANLTFEEAAKFKDTMVMRFTEAEAKVYLPCDGDGFAVNLMSEVYSETGYRGSNTVVIGVFLGLKFAPALDEDLRTTSHAEVAIPAGAIGDRSYLFLSTASDWWDHEFLRWME